MNSNICKDGLGHNWERITPTHYICIKCGSAGVLQTTGRVVNLNQ